MLTDNNLNNEGLNCLLTDIDNKIAYLTSIQYLNDVNGFKVYVDLDLYDILCEYREILLDKLLGCNCLDDEYLIFIMSKIQKRLDTIL